MSLSPWRNGTSEPLALYTGLLTLATTALVIVGAMQWRTLSNSDETLNRTLIASNRAWIRVDISLDSDLTWDTAGGHIALGFQLKNVGKTPGQIVVPVESAIHVLHGTVDPVRAGREICQESRGAPETFGFSLFPDAPHQTERKLVSIRREEIEAISKHDEFHGSFSPVLVGCVRYTFGLDERVHATPFIYAIVRKHRATGEPMDIKADEQLSRAELSLERNFSIGPAY
jgi:hypothetical protein